MNFIQAGWNIYVCFARFASTWVRLLAWMRLRINLFADINNTVFVFFVFFILNARKIFNVKTRENCCTHVLSKFSRRLQHMNQLCDSNNTNKKSNKYCAKTTTHEPPKIFASSVRGFVFHHRSVKKKKKKSCSLFRLFSLWIGIRANMRARVLFQHSILQIFLWNILWNILWKQLRWMLFSLAWIHDGFTTRRKRILHTNINYN